jgi:hypothetical protein
MSNHPPHKKGNAMYSKPITVTLTDGATAYLNDDPILSFTPEIGGKVSLMRDEDGDIRLTFRTQHGH